MTVPDTSEIVLTLLKAAVPERAAEISNYFKKYHPAMEVVKDQAGITMNANRYRIQFSLKTFETFWLIGFIGWKTIEVYAPAILDAPLTEGTVDGALASDEGLYAVEQDHKGRMSIAHSFMQLPDVTQINWPPDVPRPTADRTRLSNMQEQVAFDLTCIATAFVMFHELRHVMFAQDGNAPPACADEELACDLWARGMISDKLAMYAEQHHHNYQQVLLKRAMGMALGAFILHTITPEHVRWGTQEYPSIAVRIEALINGTPLPDDSHFWVFMASMLVGVFRQAHRPVDIAPQSAKDLVQELIRRLI